MLTRPITAKLCQTRDGRPLATVEGLPGDGADLTPGDLRALAAALLRVAEDAEGRKVAHRGRPMPVQSKSYSLENTP
jgi:hypothetical protein